MHLARYREAETELLLALDILLSTIGDGEDGAQGIYRSLVNLYRAWGKPEKGAEYRALLAENDEP